DHNVGTPRVPARVVRHPRLTGRATCDPHRTRGCVAWTQHGNSRRVRSAEGYPVEAAAQFARGGGFVDFPGGAADGRERRRLARCSLVGWRFAPRGPRLLEGTDLG